MTKEDDRKPTAEPGDDVLSASGEFLVYQTEDGSTRVECRFEEETIWLSQAVMADLYQTSKQNISLHLRNLFEEHELDRASVIKDYLTTAPDEKRYRVKHYNLDAVLAVGYRVRSHRGTEFRRWATDRLREYLTKAFVMDDERLKNPPGPGVPDYFDELLERIRDIRASERRMYLRVREIFALAADYEPSAKDTQRFFQQMQNKLHYAATGQTAAELIHSRADHSASNMGLTSWKAGEVRSADVIVAKNYLDADEITELNRIVTMWLDFAEDQARRRRQVFMQDWQEKLNQFLAFNDREVLTGHGSIRRSTADDRARAEYARFEERRRALKEAEGEEASIRALEELARKGPESGNDGGSSP